MKIYTKTGDSGTTGILGKTRLDKDDVRIECYGTVDELNSVMGMCVGKVHDSIRDDCQSIQHVLFEIGTELAYEEYHPILEEKDVLRVERLIDVSESQLPALTSFILPGGSEVAVFLQFARTVCRRAERRLVSYARNNNINTHTLSYLNRLSDLLFSWSRLVNHLDGEVEIEWKSRSQR